MGKGPKYFSEFKDAVILYPGNYINDVEGEKLEEACDTFVNSGVKKVVVDFTETDMINSIGISILIGVIEKVRGAGGVILFSGLKKVNHDIFTLIGLTKIVGISTTQEEALSRLKASNGG